MAKANGLKQRFLVGGVNLSGDTGAINRCASPRGVMECPGVDVEAMETVLLHATGILEWTAWFNPATGRAHDTLSPLLTSDRDLMWVLAPARGSAVAMLRGKQINYDPVRAPDGSLTFGVQASGSAGVPLEWGVSLTAPIDTHASADDSASVDGGAATSDGAAAQLQLLSLGSGTVTVIVEESSDDGGSDAFTTRIAFDAASAAGAQRKTVAGAVERYLRVSTSGTFTDAEFVVGVRRGTAQDTEAYA